MTLSTLREDAADKAERLAHLKELIKLVDAARDAVEAADLYAWSNFENYDELSANETSPYSFSFIISELGAIGEMLKKKGGDAG